MSVFGHSGLLAQKERLGIELLEFFNFVWSKQSKGHVE